MVLESDHIRILGQMVQATQLKLAYCCLTPIQRVQGFDCSPCWGSFAIIPCCINFEKDCNLPTLFDHNYLCAPNPLQKLKHQAAGAWQRVSAAMAKCNGQLLVHFTAVCCILVQTMQSVMLYCNAVLCILVYRLCAGWFNAMHCGAVCSILLQFKLHFGAQHWSIIAV